MSILSTAAFAGSIPEKYDHYLGPLVFEPFAIDLVTRIDVQQTQSVLEIACGTGRVTRQLKKALPPSTRLVATDLNPDMISVAKALINDKDVEWQTADAQNLPYPDGQFDLVVCQFGLMFVPDRPKAFAEAFRVLKKGGVLLFNTWDAIEHNGFIHTAAEVIDSFFEEPPVFYHVPFAMHDEKELQTLCANAGFGNVRTTLVKKETSTPSARNVALGLVEGSPVYNEITGAGEEELTKVIDAVEKAIAAKYGDNPAKGTLQAIICRAEKL